MKRLVFVTPDDLPHGFAMAGLEQLAVSAAAVTATVEELVQDADVGVLILDERLLPEVDEAWLKKLEMRWSGILLVLPAPQPAAEGGEDYLQRMIRRALGYHVRIRE